MPKSVVAIITPPDDPRHPEDTEVILQRAPAGSERGIDDPTAARLIQAPPIMIPYHEKLKGTPQINGLDAFVFMLNTAQLEQCEHVNYLGGLLLYYLGFVTEVFWKQNTGDYHKQRIQISGRVCFAPSKPGDRAAENIIQNCIPRMADRLKAGANKESIMEEFGSEIKFTDMVKAEKIDFIL